jgi:hypothetical protein
MGTDSHPQRGLRVKPRLPRPRDEPKQLAAQIRAITIRAITIRAITGTSAD